MRLYWRAQPYDKDSCGQVALAVVLNVPYKRAVRLVGHEGPTKTRDLVPILRAHGFDCPDRCQIASAPYRRPPLAIAKLMFPGFDCGWHWVVVQGEKIYDGASGNRRGEVFWPRGAKLTSYLPLTPSS